MTVSDAAGRLHPRWVANFGKPAPRRVAVRVTPDAERQVRAGHPWLFEDSVTATSHDGGAGDLAVIFDSRRRFLAIGLYDPASPIRVRILHQGRPVPIDDAWWRARVDAALARRAPLVRSGTTTGYRCVNGENDGFPGLVADRYDATCVVKLYSPAWFAHLSGLVPMLSERLGARTVVMRLARRLKRSSPADSLDGVTLSGPPPSGPVRFVENGLTFDADVERGPKTGWFLDQRDNRARTRELLTPGGTGAGADGPRVLDVFASSGGFSVHAAAAGATLVRSVDISAPALEALERNFAANRRDLGVRRCRVEPTRGDGFEILASLADRGETFDVVILDPPAFVQRRGELDAGLRAYRRLTELGLAVLAPRGILVQSSCSGRVSPDRFYGVVRDAAGAVGVTLEEVARTSHGIDHPVTFPQGAYLKTLFARRAPQGRGAGGG